MHHRPVVIVLLIAALALPLWHVHVIDGHVELVHNDLTGRLVGTRAALRGQDPYSPRVLRDIQTAYYGRPLQRTDVVDPQRFAYPAYLVTLLAPLAPLPWSTACLVFLLIVTPLLITGIWGCVRLVCPNLSPRATALTAFLAFSSWPVIWALRLVQPTLLVAIAVFLGCFLLNRRNDLLAGSLLAFSVLKPPLVLPLLLWLLIWAVVHRAWRLLASFALTFALLSLVTESITPEWFQHWRLDLQGYGPNTMLPLQSVAGYWPGLLATLLLLVWSAWLLWSLRCSPAGSAEFSLAISIALSAAVCANLMRLAVIYDEVLIIPSCLILVFSRPSSYYSALARRVSIALIVYGFALVPVAIIGESLFSPSRFWDAFPYRCLILPAVVTVALALQAHEVLRTHRAESFVDLSLTADPSL
jgi:Glycosyltransferase family 87